MKKGSVVLTTGFTLIFLGALGALGVFLPRLLELVSPYFPMLSQNRRVILTAFYFCLPFAAGALACLLLLLRCIRRDQPFSAVTGRLMSLISWCCVAVGGITLAAAFFYVPLALVTLAMAFVFLIVRVVRLCFLKATELKEENSLTI